MCYMLKQSTTLYTGTKRRERTEGKIQHLFRLHRINPKSSQAPNFGQGDSEDQLQNQFFF